jgi:hypothetical protein
MIFYFALEFYVFMIISDTKSLILAFIILSSVVSVTALPENKYVFNFCNFLYKFKHRILTFFYS